MVKNIPTIERSTKIRFGKYATDDQGENTIVFNASNAAIDTSVPGSIYMTPLRQEDDITSRDITMLTYNTETKEIIDSNVPAVDLFTINLQYVTNNDNVTSNTVQFENPTTAFVTTGNVGIQNISPTHALDVGSNVHVTKDGEVRVGPSVLIDSSVTNKIQVSGKILTSSLESDKIGISNSNPTKRLSIGSHTFVDDPATTGNTITTYGNVSAAFYHGDSYFLSNLNLDNIILQGNTAASKTVEFNKSGTSLITASNVGIANALPVHTLDVGSNLFVDDKGSNVLVVTGNTFTSRKVLIGSNVTIDTLGSNVVEITGNTYTSRKALIGSNVTIDTLGSNVVEVTGNTYTSRKALVGSNLVMDTLGSNVVEVTGNTFTSRKALIGSNVTIDTLGSNVVEVTGNTYTSRKALIGSNVTIDTLGSNVVEVTGNTYTSRKALVGSNVTMDTLGSNVIEVTGNTFTSRKALVGSNLVMDTLGSNVVEVTGNVNVSNYIKTDYITVQKDAHVKGNLLVEGTTTTIDTINTTFGDAVISLANNNTETSTDIGIIMKQPGSNASPTVTFRGEEKEMMIGYTLNSSLDTEITPDSANVIDLHVYGNVIAQNNITLTSGELTAITLNGNVVGDNVNTITLSGNNVNAITLNGNVIADNVYVTNNIETTSGFFKGNGGILSNVTLQQVTDAGNTTSNTVQFTNAHTAFTTELTSNVGVKLDQLSNVNVTGLVEDNILIYDGSNWVNDYNVHSFVKIRNETGGTLYRGNTVYIVDGYTSNIANVALAKSNSPNTMPCIGIIHDNVNNQSEGVAVSYGKVQNVNTDGFTEGQTVYVSNTNAGSVMSSKPFGQNDLIQNVGVCVKSDASHGVIFVTGVGRANDMPNAEEVTDQPSYVYVNSTGNELKKITTSSLNANNQTLDMVTSWSNSTQNTIQSTHATTGFISTGNVHINSNIFVSGITDGSTNSHIPMVDHNTGKFVKSPAYVTSDGTYVINAAEAEFTGNLSFTGNTYVFESNTVTIEDRVLGIANNNTSHTLDIGIIMGYPEHNIAFIHHGAATGVDPHEHVMTLGYTQNTVTDNHILDDVANLITFEVIGNVTVQNNLTLTSGDITAITVNSNVVGDNVSVITLNGNVVGDNVVATNMYGTIAGANTVNASIVNAITVNSNVISDNVVATNGIYGVIAGSNTISASTISAITINSNVVSDNVVATNGMYGVIVGSNTISASTINAVTVNSNVISDNVVATNGIYGVIAGSNTISASTINAVTVNSNVVSDNVVATNGIYGVIAGSNTISASTISAVTVNSNVVSDNVVATNGMYGTIAGSNTISASTIYVGTGTPSLGDYELRVEGDTEITGNLLVGGTTTTVNTENLIVKDPIIQLGDAVASVDSGLLLARQSDTDNVYVGYDQTESEFVIGFTDNHAGESSITVKDGVNFKMNVYGNVEASYFFGDGSQLSGIQTATPTLASVVDEGNTTSNVVQFSNATTGIEITSNIDFVNKITLKSTSVTKSNLFVVNAIQLDPGPSSSPVPAAMTANSSGGNTASSGDSSVDAYKAFDGSDSTHYTSPLTYSTSSKGQYGASPSSSSLGGVQGEWIKLQIPSAITPTSVFLKSRPDGTDSAGRPASWRILGSNDNTNWTQLHSSTTVVDDSSGTTESFTNTTSYSYLALQVNNINSNYGKWTLSRLSFTDTSILSPSNNVLSYNTTTGEIYDSGGQGGSSFVNITEEAANVLIGSNLTINSFGSNVLTVSGNVSADNITIGGLNIAASPFALDDVVSVYEGANVTANVLTLGGLVTSGNVNTGNVITTGDITISGNTTSQNIKLTNTDISATISSGTITIDAKEKTYGTAPLVVSTTDVSNLVFSNFITGAQIVIPILASGGNINISKELTNVNFYAMTSDVSVAQDKHALMTLSNLYGNIYMNAIGFS